MKQYIEREELSKAMKIWQNDLIETYGENDEYVKCLDSVLLGVDNIPAADVRPVVRSTWKRIDFKPCGHDYECSSCGWKNDMATNFCPNCGSEMR